jgi:hypothetical protein
VEGIEMKVGDKVQVTVSGEAHRGVVNGRRRTMSGTVVVVKFWHQGRDEEIEFFENDGALHPLAPRGARCECDGCWACRNAGYQVGKCGFDLEGSTRFCADCGNEDKK